MIELTETIITDLANKASNDCLERIAGACQFVVDHDQRSDLIKETMILLVAKLAINMVPDRPELAPGVMKAIGMGLINNAGVSARPN